jgi:hypothetical protein
LDTYSERAMMGQKDVAYATLGQGLEPANTPLTERLEQLLSESWNTTNEAVSTLSGIQMRLFGPQPQPLATGNTSAGAQAPEAGDFESRVFRALKALLNEARTARSLAHELNARI